MKPMTECNHCLDWGINEQEIKAGADRCGECSRNAIPDDYNPEAIVAYGFISIFVAAAVLVWWLV